MIADRLHSRPALSPFCASDDGSYNETCETPRSPRDSWLWSARGSAERRPTKDHPTGESV